MQINFGYLEGLELNYYTKIEEEAEEEGKCVYRGKLIKLDQKRVEARFLRVLEGRGVVCVPPSDY